MGTWAKIGHIPPPPNLQTSLMSGESSFTQAIGGVFLPPCPVPYGFWRPDLVLHSHIVFDSRTSFWLAGLAGELAGWLAAGWVAGWMAGGWPAGGLAGLGWLAGLAGCIYYMSGWYLMDVGSWFYGHESDLVLTSFWTCPWICMYSNYWLYHRVEIAHI